MDPDEIAALVSQNPDITNAEIARRTGLSRSHAGAMARLPGVKRLVAERLDAGNVAGQAGRSIASIVAALGALVDDTLASPDGLTPADVQSLLGYLAALTGTLDRLGRAGISLEGTADLADTSALDLLILKAYRRGAARMALTPHRGTRLLALLDGRIARAQRRADRVRHGPDS